MLSGGKTDKIEVELKKESLNLVLDISYSLQYLCLKNQDSFLLVPICDRTIVLHDMFSSIRARISVPNY
jgi:hypothetical protein